MGDFQEDSAPRVVRILVPEGLLVQACTTRCELKLLKAESCSNCYVAHAPSSSEKDCPGSGPADVVNWHETAKKRIAEIRTSEAFDLANVIFYSSTLDSQQLRESESTGPVPKDRNTLQHELCTAQAAVCDRGHSPWKRNLARLLCCSLSLIHI